MPKRQHGVLGQCEPSGLFSAQQYPPPWPSRPYGCGREVGQWAQSDIFGGGPTGFDSDGGISVTQTFRGFGGVCFVANVYHVVALQNTSIHHPSDGLWIK